MRSIRVQMTDIVLLCGDAVTIDTRLVGLHWRVSDRCWIMQWNYVRSWPIMKFRGETERARRHSVILNGVSTEILTSAIPNTSCKRYRLYHRGHSSNVRCPSDWSTHPSIHPSMALRPLLGPGLHSSLHSARLLHPLIPRICDVSLRTTPSHLILGFPTGLVLWIFPLRTFYEILSSSSDVR
jgi:hypothetical protein